jgi:hypothetical protein
MTDTLRTGWAAKISMRAISRMVLGCVVGAVLLTAAAPARAGEDDKAPLDTKILRGILHGLGLQTEVNSIDYNERAPLVIPPSRDLPPPETDIAVKNPNWPDDPDIKRARELKAAEKADQTIKSDWEMNRVLRPNELNVGRRRASREEKNNTSTNDFEMSRPLRPSALGYKGGLFGNLFGKDKDETAQFTGEPPRVSLTDPPPGYQTPSPNEPYGRGKESYSPKATNYLIEHGTQPR